MRLIRLGIVLLALLFLTGPTLAWAEGITTRSIQDNWSKLTEEQKATLAASIAQQASENKVSALGTVTTPPVAADEVEPWLVLIDKVGQGLVRLAKDLGVTANELLVTPVGVITVGLVAYHVMGREILEIFSALMWAAVVFPALGVFFFKSVIPIDKYAEVKKQGWRGEYTVHKPIRRKMVFGTTEEFNVDWTFAILATLAMIVFLALLP